MPKSYVMMGVSLAKLGRTEEAIAVFALLEASGNSEAALEAMEDID